MRFIKPISLFTTVFLSLAGVTSLGAKATDFPKDYAQTAKPATIKVLLCERSASLILDVKGSYKLFCPHTNVLLSSGSSAKIDHITSSAQGLIWGKLIPGADGIRVVPANGQTSIFVNGIQYKGCIEVYDLGGTLRVINEVDVENYLRSILAIKFFNITEPEVLNALAIIARTNTYHLAQKESAAPWHITAEDAAYKGHAVTLQNLALEKAIEDTRHAVLTYHSQPFATCYTENSAGKTASFSSVFRKSALCPEGVILSGMETERQKSAWSFQVSKQELAMLMNISSFDTFTPCIEKKSNKVYAVKIKTGTDTKTLDFFAFQEALGKTKLKSNDFNVEVLQDTVRFAGYGEGCGVGLCLHTAALMAKQGLDAKRILSEFFFGTTLEKIRSLPKNENKVL